MLESGHESLLAKLRSGRLRSLHPALPREEAGRPGSPSATPASSAMSFSGAGHGRGARRKPYQPAKARQMVCGFCGEVKNWPSDFRVSYFAECKGCYPEAKPGLFARLIAKLLFCFHYVRLRVKG